MYTLVLMTAMGTTPQTAGFGGFFRDLFGWGCCGGCCGGARYSCGGCSGAADYYGSCCGGGCCGGGFLGLGLFSRRDYCGCCGGGFARSYGCYGSSSYSHFGGPVVSYTPMVNVGLMCQGGPVPSAPPPVFDTAPINPGIPPSIPYAPPEPAPPAAIAPERLGLRPAGYTGPAAVTTANGQTARATVVVRLPADARLYADGTALRLTGTERRFVTPELPAGQEYTYRFRVEYERDGEVVSVTKKLPVRAGGTVAIEFADLTAAARPKAGPATAATPVSNPAAPAVAPVAPPAATPGADAPGSPSPAPSSDRATITVKLPPGATLYVDDRKNPSAEPVRQFSTPPLPTGREYAYLLKAEVVRDGRPESLIQKVPFRAGERVTVDFTGIGR